MTPSAEVAREAAIAAALTGLMILLFLGSWRSTLIVCTSIPLSIATSLVILTALGETINVMTLGGLALAVGILVDDATVEIENTHRNMSEKKPLVRAILDSAQQVAAPAFVSTLSICIVFIPVVLLTGAAKYLFTPLAMAVAFAMMASYFLSRTIVPTMMHFLLASEIRLYQDEGASEREERENWIWRWHMKFDRQFEKMQHHYKNALEWCLENSGLTLILFFGFIALSLPLTFFIGGGLLSRTSTPARCACTSIPPVGLRIEDSEQYFASIEKDRSAPSSRRTKSTSSWTTSASPTGGINLAFGNSATISNSDGEIQIALKPGKRKTTEYQRLLRDKLAEKYPGATFFFTPPTSPTRSWTSASPPPLTSQIRTAAAKPTTSSPEDHEAHRRHPRRGRRPHPPAGHLPHPAGQRGPHQGPPDRPHPAGRSPSPPSSPSPAQARRHPTSGSTPSTVSTTRSSPRPPSVPPQLPAGSWPAFPSPPPTATSRSFSATWPPSSATRAPIIIDHYNIQPVYDIYADVDRRDLGGVATEIRKIIDEEKKGLPPGNRHHPPR